MPLSTMWITPGVAVLACGVGMLSGNMSDHKSTLSERRMCKHSPSLHALHLLQEYKLL